MLTCVYGHPYSGGLFICGMLKHLEQNGYQAIGKTGSKALMCKGRTLIAIYVDDVKASGPPEELAQLWKTIDQRYSLKTGDLECTEFLGISIRRTPTQMIYSMKIIVTKLQRHTRRISAISAEQPCRLFNNLKNINKEDTQTNPDPRIQKLIGQILWLT